MNASIELVRIGKNAPLLIGLVAVAALVAIGVLGPAVAPYDPNSGVSIVWAKRPDGTEIPLSPPTLPDAQHFLGTDELGRDQWSRILWGAWLTLSVVLASTALRFVIGVSLGIAAGWYGGFAATGVRLLSRGVAALPQLMLAVLLVLVTRPLGAIGFIASLAVVGWPEVAELVTAEAGRARRQLFVEAARSLGTSESRIARTHLLSLLTPQLLTLGALETGAVLLLLAELGIIGLFVSGATFLVGEFGPLGPLTGRVPEWGQMLGSIQFYAMFEQLSTLLPAVCIVAAAAGFTFLADGLRNASDPHSTMTLRPAAFSVLTKVLAVALCASAAGFLGANLRPGTMSTDEGRMRSNVTAQSMWPGSELVAVVARYVSPAGIFTRPDRLTFYYRNDRGEVLRISYLHAERLATEVRAYETEDELDFATLRPLPAGLAAFDAPAAYANEHGGGQLRADLGAPLMRSILTWPTGEATPTYVVTIGQSRQPVIQRYCCFDGLSGELAPGSDWHAQ